MLDKLIRPIVGIENRTPQEVFDIMSDRIRSSLQPDTLAARCEYCDDGTLTGLPGNACENCMNTGLKYPECSK